ncbi:MAG TPA: response regulator transcription factor [Rubrobacter sp.]|nr:response regulator transcription factor [Rubrobacter sp.]
MLTRILAVLGVGVWCIFILLVSVVFVIDRGLANVGIVWVAILGIGVVAPILIMRQINRAIAAHEESRRSFQGTMEKELLGALEERGMLTPTTAALRTSLTVDEASKMLDTLARAGHLDLRMEEGVMAYAPSEPGWQGLGKGSASSPGAESGKAPGQIADDPLSERELEVLGLLASGKTNSEVAGDLIVSVGTVKSHTGNIYRKLGARNRAEALNRARELGLIR